jgi:hypothetical protein
MTGCLKEATITWLPAMNVKSTGQYGSEEYEYMAGCLKVGNGPLVTSNDYKSNWLKRQ